MTIETMRVKCEVTADNDQGFYVINKEDFNAEKHVDFDAVKVDETKPAEPSWKK